MRAIPPSPSSIPDANENCAAAIVESYQALSRQECRYLSRLREFDLHRGYQLQLKGGKRAANTVEWLRIVCGVERAAAEENLRVAYSLLKVPAIESAFCRGELSYRKVRALSPVADAVSERGLLDFALVMTDGQVEEYCRRVRGRDVYTRTTPSSKEVSLASDDRITVYHNPACSKCRGALAILRERGVEFDTVEYLHGALGKERVERIIDLIDDSPAELVRKDANFRALGLVASDYTSADAVAELLAQHPQLMQRPVVLRGQRGVIARPPEKLEVLL